MSALGGQPESAGASAHHGNEQTYRHGFHMSLLCSYEERNSKQITSRRGGNFMGLNRAEPANRHPI
jgi:hypothetical protein